MPTVSRLQTATPQPASQPSRAPAPAAPAAPPPEAGANAARSEFVGAGTTALQQLLARRPALKTNQDLINYFHKVGGGSWGGAESAAKAVGADLNELVSQRRGSAAAYAKSKAPAETPRPAAAPTASASSQPTLRRGADGPAVERLQRLLQVAGCNPGGIDGSFGPKTLAAVKSFQRGHGLEADGVVGPKTWAALLGGQQPQTPATQTPGTSVPGSSTPAGEAVSARSCSLSVSDVSVYKVEGKKGFAFRSEMTIDADGSPRAYHPESSKGLDALGNAGSPGSWWGIATNSSGKPYVQHEGDPAPGYYVSTTALMDSSHPASDPRRYVDSEQIPFIAVPPALTKAGCKLGDLVAVRNEKNGKVYYAVIADIGPKNHLGEGSMKLARELGINDSPRNGGASGGVQYVAFPGSKIGWPVTNAQIQAEGARLFSQWGGEAQLSAATRR